MEIPRFLKKIPEKVIAWKIGRSIKLPEVKKLGPTEPVVFGVFKEAGKNDYGRIAYKDRLKQRLHSFKREVLKGHYLENKPATNIQLQKFVCRLLVGFNVSFIIEHNGVLGSLEQNYPINKITPQKFESLYPEKYYEARAECEILKLVFNDHDRKIHEASNIQFYRNGQFSLFDFQFVNNFFEENKSEFLLDLFKIDRLDKEVLLKMKEKILFLKKFYNSPAGDKHFKEILNSLSVNFTNVFTDETGIVSNPYHTPANFHSLMMHRMDLALEIINQKLSNL